MDLSDGNRLHTFRWTVDSDAEGQRLDHFLMAQQITYDDNLGVSRARLQKLIETGQVLVDGDSVRAAAKLRLNQEIVLTITPPERPTVAPEEMPLTIRYEDEYLVVVEKPRGLVVHPGPGHPGGTLVNGLLFRHALGGGTDPVRPGIVHRLDKDTSGLIVVAKREDAHAVLARQFHDHTVDRRYRALVSGSPPEQGEWETLYGRSHYHRRAFSSKVKRGKRAVTRFRVAKRFKGAAEIRVTLLTGRTHQVRVHCHDHGFSVLGDRLYTPRHLSAPLKQIHVALGCQALHAEILGFDHPATSERLVFESTPPEPYLTALDALKSLG
jgi:23S rRNA pseudouridine1911/1915/1917 synthase